MLFKNNCFRPEGISDYFIVATREPLGLKSIILQQQRVILIIYSINSLGVSLFTKITQIFQPALTKGKTADFFLSNNNGRYKSSATMMSSKAAASRAAAEAAFSNWSDMDFLTAISDHLENSFSGFCDTCFP